MRYFSVYRTSIKFVLNVKLFVNVFTNFFLKGKMMEMLKRFIKDDRGLETVEYAIIAGLIVVGVIATVTSIGIWVNAKFTALNTGLGTP